MKRALMAGSSLGDIHLVGFKVRVIISFLLIDWYYNHVRVTNRCGNSFLLKKKLYTCAYDDRQLQLRFYRKVVFWSSNIKRSPTDFFGLEGSFFGWQFRKFTRLLASILNSIPVIRAIFMWKSTYIKLLFVINNSQQLKRNSIILYLYISIHVIQNISFNQ